MKTREMSVGERSADELGTANTTLWDILKRAKPPVYSWSFSRSAEENVTCEDKPKNLTNIKLNCSITEMKKPL